MDRTFLFLCFLTHKIRTLKKSDIAVVTRSGAVPAGCHLALAGNSEGTGSWNPSRAVTMQYAGSGLWEAALSFSHINSEIPEYKFIIRKDKDNSLVEWEEGNNRIFPADVWHGDPGTHIIVSETPYRSRSQGLRHAGTAIPVFSLRSRDSWGIGDFGDLKKMADWAALTGQQVLQILPVNDTTMFHNWIDSYPYGGISIMALHPLYADIQAMCPQDDTVDLSQFEKKRKTE